jgi:hypothetical protein
LAPIISSWKTPAVNIAPSEIRLSVCSWKGRSQQKSERIVGLDGDGSTTFWEEVGDLGSPFVLLLLIFVFIFSFWVKWGKEFDFC